VIISFDHIMCTKNGHANEVDVGAEKHTDKDSYSNQGALYNHIFNSVGQCIIMWISVYILEKNSIKKDLLPKICKLLFTRRINTDYNPYSLPSRLLKHP
jgi:hypothetical protein